MTTKLTQLVKKSDPFLQDGILLGEQSSPLNVMFQGTEAHRSPQGIRETLSVVVVVSIILNPIFDFAESGVLCLPELSLHGHLFWWDIRLLYWRQSCFLVDAF